jgi:hypothetical protein
MMVAMMMSSNYNTPLPSESLKYLQTHGNYKSVVGGAGNELLTPTYLLGNAKNFIGSLIDASEATNTPSVK